TLEGAIDVDGGAPIRVDQIGRIGNKAPGIDMDAVRVDRRQPMPGREPRNQRAVNKRRPAARYDQTDILDPRAKSVMPRSISPAARTPTGRNSTPNCEAADWIAPNCPLPAAMATSRRTAARVMPGAMSLSSSSHLPLMLYSNKVNPVVLPPGRAKALRPGPGIARNFRPPRARRSRHSGPRKDRPRRAPAGTRPDRATVPHL